jgi:hypothetical protein
LFVLIFVLSVQPGGRPASAQATAPQTPYAALGLEATNWITSFQVTPLNDSWGIPYREEQAWGLDPYFFENGTITAGVGGIGAGERQSLAYLIGGHDAGEGTYATLMAYLQTKDPRYLDIFNVYNNYFQSAQLPSVNSITPAESVVVTGGKNVTVNNSGFWAEQASAAAGDNGTYGSPNDKTTLEAIYPAAEHGNPIAIALIAYYRITHDQATLSMLNRYGNWLVRTQIQSGQYAGAFPVTQYYYALGWKPRMYETTESAWVLSELYLITGNQTYLNSAEAAGRYMLSRQFIGPQWEGTPVYGALPYEWNETHYTNSVSTNHAGYTILAWSQLYRITHNATYLDAARTYANWLLSFQITAPTTNWGNHTYANDSMAVGGFYYGYNTQKHEFGWRVAESLWSASYAVPALLTLYQITENENYHQAALLAAGWLIRMKYPDQSLFPLQALAIVKYPLSSWWGPFPQYYQPDMSQIESAGIVSFVNQGRLNESSIRDVYPTWFERTFSVDFNIIDYEMASRGPTFMKMTWSWWPSVGFEPRYGGDIAFGAFAVDGYLTFNATLQMAVQSLAEIRGMTGNDTTALPENITTAYNQAVVSVATSAQNFNLGWFALARAQANDALALTKTVLNYIEATLPLRQTNQLLLTLVAVALVVIIVSNFYWYRRSRRKAERGLRGRRTRRKR